MTETDTKTIIDETGIANYLQITTDEARACIALSGRGYEYNGIYFVNTDETLLEIFDQLTVREAQAYLRRKVVLDFIDDNQGCRRIDIRNYMESQGDKPSYDAIDLILTLLTEEGVGIYEDDDDRLYSI